MKVSKLTDELNMHKSKVAALEQAERSSRLSIEADRIKTEETVRCCYSSFYVGTYYSTLLQTCMFCV